MDLPLSLACSECDRTQGLRDGTVPVHRWLARSLFKAFEQGLAPRQFEPAGLFAPETQEEFVI